MVCAEAAHALYYALHRDSSSAPDSDVRVTSRQSLCGFLLGDIVELRRLARKAAHAQGQVPVSLNA